MRELHGLIHEAFLLGENKMEKDEKRYAIRFRVDGEHRPEGYTLEDKCDFPNYGLCDSMIFTNINRYEKEVSLACVPFDGPDHPTIELL